MRSNPKPIKCIIGDHLDHNSHEESLSEANNTQSKNFDNFSSTLPMGVAKNPGSSYDQKNINNTCVTSVNVFVKVRNFGRTISLKVSNSITIESIMNAACPALGSRVNSIVALMVNGREFRGLLGEKLKDCDTITLVLKDGLLGGSSEPLLAQNPSELDSDHHQQPRQ